MADKKDKDITEFEFEDKKYKVKRPTNKIRRESEPIYAEAYRAAIHDNFLLDAEIDEILENRGFSIKSVNKKRDELNKKIRRLELRLTDEDYSDFTVGKEIAFDVQDLRSQLLTIDGARMQLDTQSVERHAENRRFSYFAYRCCTDEANEPLWGDFEEFENDESPLAIRAATELLLLVFNVNQNSQKEINANRVENRWLKKHGFMNDNLQLVNLEGKPVDRQNRLINENNEFIDEDGERVDEFGHRIDENGNLIFKEDIIKEKKDKEKRKAVKKKDTEQQESIMDDLMSVGIKE